jgi:hypothetical protein
MERSIVETSPGAGIEFQTGLLSDVRVTQTRVRNNAGVGIQLSAGEVSLWNNLITGNLGGVAIAPGILNTEVFNNTIADNFGIGLTIDASADTTQLTNNILFNNTGGNLQDDSASTVSTTNLTSDPDFLGGGDYRVTSTSAAADTGTPLTAFTVAFDGQPRPQGTEWDIGAFERAGAGAPPVTRMIRALPGLGVPWVLPQ